MKRRRFLETIGAMALGVGAAPCTLWGRWSGGPSLRSQVSKNWTWVHGGSGRSSAEWRSDFARIKRAGIDAVLVSGGETALLSDAAHAEGLEFHRWVWVLNRNGDGWARENHPEWFTVNRDGESTLDHPPYVDYYRWVCPTREPVREYLRGVFDEIASDQNVDGVHLDYIRHSDVILPIGLWDKYDLVQDQEYPEFDYCYCDVCRETFRELSGSDPLELPDPTRDPEWKQFRYDSITGLVSGLADVVHAHGKPITAAVFPTPDMARLMVHQDWDAWPLDAVFPMIYHSFYLEDVSWVESATREGVAALPAQRPLYSGLYLPSLTPDELAQAVRVAREGGSAGVALFEMGGLSDDHLVELRAVSGR